jgi:hypothetical protein
MKTNKLPDKPSELLMVAMQDLEVIESMPDKYVVMMSKWHNYSHGSTCSVCHAGAVMANTLKADAKHTYFPEEFGEETKCKLMAIDCFRRGLLVDALERMGVTIPSSLEDVYFNYNQGDIDDFEEFGEDITDVTDLDDLSDNLAHRDIYKNYICGLIGILQAEGL